MRQRSAAFRGREQNVCGPLKSFLRTRVIDARGSATAKTPAADAQLHLLRPGMRWKP
jgi:hypothetical protein